MLLLLPSLCYYLPPLEPLQEPLWKVLWQLAYCLRHLRVLQQRLTQTLLAFLQGQPLEYSAEWLLYVNTFAFWALYAYGMGFYWVGVVA